MGKVMFLHVCVCSEDEVPHGLWSQVPSLVTGLKSFLAYSCHRSCPKSCLRSCLPDRGEGQGEVEGVPLSWPGGDGTLSWLGYCPGASGTPVLAWSSPLAG